jgi:CheY-like chemotaxis protein
LHSWEIVVRVLVAEVDKVIRDQVLVGLESFADIETDAATGVEALDLVRKRDFQCIFVGFNQSDTSGQDFLDKLKSMNPQTELILLAPEAHARRLSQDHTGSRPAPRHPRAWRSGWRLRVFSVLRKPLVPLEFYRTVGRLRKRLRTTNES